MVDRRAVFLSIGFCVAAATACRADDSTRLDFSLWQQMPVFDRGRRMPLDTFARSVVRKICGRTRLTLNPTGLPPDSPAHDLFPEGKPRKLDAAELLFSWLVEPEKWQRVAFLIGRHEVLRRDILQLPLRDEQGHRLKHVSPRELLGARRFRMKLAQLGEQQRKARAEEKEFDVSGVDKRVYDLYEAYSLFRLVTFHPAAPADSHHRFFEKLAVVVETWDELAESLRRLPPPAAQQDREPPPAETADQTVRKLVSLMHGGDFALQDADAAAVALRRSTAKLAGRIDALCRSVFRDQTASEHQRAALNELAARTAELAQTATEMHMALYDDGRSLRLVPALSPAALKADRDEDDDNQPWLSLSALLLGSEALLAGYPKPELKAARKAFQDVKAVYLDRGASDRPPRFAAAMERLAAAVRRLGEGIEPVRRELDVPGKQEDKLRMLAETAYPPVGYTDTEWRYNRLHPFLWSWVVCLISLVCFALGFGRVRKPTFWLGVVVLAVAQGLIIAGLYLRWLITGWVPVTNMFETVVFVALVGAMLGLWFTLLPLLWPGMTRAWRMASMPRLIRLAARGTSESASPAGRGEFLANWILLLPQLYLMYRLFRALTLESYGSGGEAPIISLLPATDVGSSVPTGNDVLTWAVGWCVLVPTVWYLPRLALSALLSPVTVACHWVAGDASGLLDEVLKRRLFAAVGAAVGFFASLLAYFSPIFDRDIGALMPILRDNFWLTMHVLTITASYGAGALAWGLGNIALAHYLFGRYRRPEASPGLPPSGSGDHGGDPPAPPTRLARRPPEACSVLAGFIYKATQVAVLLLAVGTILGALWADVAWGRFWGWDAKEVWALISLLVYMIILHGRYAGWSGNFGLAFGSVLGLTMIVMAWYGVNYWLRSGLHTYAGGSGGQWYVAVAVAWNWLFLAAAALRYFVETRTTVDLSAEQSSPRRAPQSEPGVG